MKRMESVLLGALRREQMAETSLQKLDAEIKHLNSLVCLSRIRIFVFLHNMEFIRFCLIARTKEEILYKAVIHTVGKSFSGLQKRGGYAAH